MPKYGEHQIQQNETLEGIALKLLGSVDRVPDLIALNRLRYPYLSDDPIDQLGPALFETSLSKPYSGGLYLSLASYDARAFASGNYVLLEGSGGLIGSRFWDIGQVAAWATTLYGTATYSDELSALLPASFITQLPPGPLLYLTGQATHSYGAGTPVRIYGDPKLNRTQVLGSGMILLIPITSDDSNIISITNDQYVSLLGTDIALDSNGQLQIGTGRDLALVAGTTNLAQALRIRANTELGELIHHTDYGNALLTQIGSISSSLIATAYAGVVQCFLGDPRIGKLVNLYIEQSGDLLTINCVLELRDRAGLLTIQDLIISRS